MPRLLVNRLLVVSAALASLAALLLATPSGAAEVLKLEFENGADLTVDTSGNGLSGVVSSTSAAFFSTLTQSSDTRPSSAGSGSANFSSGGGGAFDGRFIEFVDAQFPDFGADDDFTVTLWVKPTQAYVEDSVGLRGIVAAESNLTENFEWQIDNGSSTDGAPGDPGTNTLTRVAGSVDTPFTTTNLSSTDWQQIGVSYSGAAKLATLIYDEETTGATAIQGLAMESLWVGANLFQVRAYEGLMDDLVVTDTAVVYDAVGNQQLFGDLDFSGAIDALDWLEFRSGQGDDLSALTSLGAYQVGDLDFDGDNDFDDFQAFKAVFNDAVGPGALEELIAGVPEPGTFGMLLAPLLAALGLTNRRRAAPSVSPATLHRVKQRAHRGRGLCLSVALFAVAIAAGEGRAQTTVFSADFEVATTDFSLFDNDANPVFDVTVGSISFAKGAIIDIPGDPDDGERVGAPQLYRFDDPENVARATAAGADGDGFLAGHTDWGEQALAIERNADANSQGDGSTLTGATAEWVFTDPVELDGATIDFEFLNMRGASGPQKNNYVTGYDTNGRELFSVLMVARDNFANAGNPDYDETGAGAGNQRQQYTVGYADSVGDYNTTNHFLFSTAQLAAGSVPDSNVGDGDTNGGEVGFFGNTPATINNTNTNNFFEIDDSALFSITLSDTGWTLDAQAAPTPDNASSGLADFTTVEIPFNDAQALNLARIETLVASDQGGAWYDNLEVTGNIAVIPEPLKLQVASNGEMTLVNDGNVDITIDFVQISSADVEQDGGSLDAAGFTGIGGDPNYPAGADDGQGWELADNNSDTLLIESFLTGDSTFAFATSDSASLGSGFVPGGSQDLQFLYHVVGDDGLTTGVIEYVTVSALPGDADGDGDVDGDDLIAVQTQFGNTGPTPLLGDADSDGDVDGDDLIAVQTNFGNVAAVAVPEPASLLTLAVAALGVRRQRRRA